MDPRLVQHRGPRAHDEAHGGIFARACCDGRPLRERTIFSFRVTVMVPSRRDEGVYYRRQDYAGLWRRPLAAILDAAVVLVREGETLRPPAPAQDGVTPHRPGGVMARERPLRVTQLPTDCHTCLRNDLPNDQVYEKYASGTLLELGPTTLAMGSRRMRCGLPALMPIPRTTRGVVVCLARYALPIVLMLAASPVTAFAESFVCHAIQRGESADQVARRLTGDARNTYKAWFQIMNPSSRFVPKSQYDRIRAGWRACVLKPALDRASSSVNQFKATDALEASEAAKARGDRDGLATPNALATADSSEGGGASPGPGGSDSLSILGSVNLAVVWLAAAMVLPWFGWRILDDYLGRRKTISFVMRHFAERFVHEFQRPLVRYHGGERPLRSRLRCSAGRGRFDILLAPGRGRRYPNLSDHKKNVEYDVARVVQLLNDESFVCGPLSTHAGWVVVPFQFQDRRSVQEGGPVGPNRLRAFGASARQKQVGVTCISSF